jgi:hypothetical protein
VRQMKENKSAHPFFVMKLVDTHFAMKLCENGSA